MDKCINRLIFLFFLLFSMSSVQAAETVKIAVDNGNPPFMYAKDDKAAGLYPTLLGAVFAQMGVPVEFGAYPWKRTIDMGEKGLAGIGGIYKNDERIKIYDYSEPIFSEKLVLYMNKEKKFAFNNIQDLKGKRVGVILGWSYSQEFDEARKTNLFSIDEVISDNINFKKLATDRLDCLVAIELAGEMIIQQENLQNRVEPAEKPIAINDTYVVFAKSLNLSELLSKFNTTLANMKKDGSYDKVVADFIAGN